MAEDRGPASALKGRLAAVSVPAIVEGSLEALSKRLGNRATIDDPLYGRAATLTLIDPILEKMAARFAEGKATYRHVASTTGVDRDVSEGVVVMTNVEIPIAVVAERRRLREIELRVYYASGASTRKTRTVRRSQEDPVLPQIIAHVLEALRKGAVERVLAGFEEGGRWVDPKGKPLPKRDGSIGAFIADNGGKIDMSPVGIADDGRTCCVEVAVSRNPLAEPEPAALSFERGESGLLRELRFYYEP